MKYVILFYVFMFIALIVSRAIVQYNFDDEMVQRYDETTVSVINKAQLAICTVYIIGFMFCLITGDIWA